MDKLFHTVCVKTSRLVTTSYSTSFSIGVKCLHPSIREAIYNIYGFVRFADEIVDTFHEYDREKLFNEFEEQYYKALEDKISLNPILNAFQHTVHTYHIQDELVQAFLKSMRSDLYKARFNEKEIKEYIYGSADVVGLMCLKVFVKGDDDEYERLKPYAVRLGSAFQKINFLRDLKHDTNKLHRDYFPILKTEGLNEKTKKMILEDIMEDYRVALEGIKQLPECARLGVYVAFLYYRSLTLRIMKTKAEKLMEERIRVSDTYKIFLLLKAYIDTKMITKFSF